MFEWLVNTIKAGHGMGVGCTRILSPDERGAWWTFHASFEARINPVIYSRSRARLAGFPKSDQVTLFPFTRVVMVNIKITSL